MKPKGTKLAVTQKIGGFSLLASLLLVPLAIYNYGLFYNRNDIASNTQTCVAATEGLSSFSHETLSIISDFKLSEDNGKNENSSDSSRTGNSAKISFNEFKYDKNKKAS